MKKESNNVSESPRQSTLPENRETQMIALAYDQAEKELREGTATSQLVTYFLKLGSEKEKREREKLENENALLRAKVDAIKSGQTSEQLYKEAIEAMKLYTGGSKDD